MGPPSILRSASIQSPVVGTGVGRGDLAVGSNVGALVGSNVGRCDGTNVGPSDGTVVGVMEGVPVGSRVG